MENVINTVPKKNALIVQHNKLVEARYRLTLQEMRIVLWLLAEIQIGDTDFKSYRVRIKDLADFI
jgi:Initiator Replication protein